MEFGQLHFFTAPFYGYTSIAKTLKYMHRKRCFSAAKFECILDNKQRMWYH